MTVKIVVAGDVSVDWYYWPVPSDSNKRNKNWEYYEGTDKNPQPGGAVLLAKWLRDILQIRTGGSPFSLSLASQSCEDLVRKRPSEVLHTNIYLDLFPPFSSIDRKEEIKVYRVKNCLGYTTPNNTDNKEQFPVPLEISGDQENADIVLIYDAGKGFRYQEQVWLKALKGDQRPIVIYSMSPPLFKGALWDHILKFHKDKLILILNADDLRKIGINISRSISWEKSATELLWEMNHKEDLAEIKELSNVITRFNYDGAIYYKGKAERSKLFFDPVSLEGDFWDYEKFGDMRAINLMFIADLSSCLISELKEKESNSHKEKDSQQNGSGCKSSMEGSIKEGLEQGLKEGLIKSREFLINGYGNSNGKHDFFGLACLNINQKDSGNNQKDSGNNQKDSRYYAAEQDNPCALGQDSSENKSSESSAGYIADTLLPSIEEIDEYSDPRQSNSHLWTILKERAKEEISKTKGKSVKATEESGKENVENDSTYLEKLAFVIVKKGFSNIKDFPVGTFGKLTTVDRVEIESFRTIKNILEEYIHSEKNQKPLSIAVFGSPGSGKSFGITQVAETIDSEKTEKVTFNISQFTSVKDLANAFHRIRDVFVKGKIPLVFFDEFDSKFEDEELGWIKYFLVPMQDGEFMDFDTMHPIGKSVFVFAGSICYNFKDFVEFCSNSNPQSKSYGNYSGTDTCRKISNKCPDFLSRLRGYVDILGLNRTSKDDETYIIRRAIQLRSLIEANAPKIIKENHAHISCNLLNALINVPEYMHGARSMQAIVEMSLLYEKGSWEEADLPPKNQLELHIKSIDEFFALLTQKKQSCIDIK